MHEILGTRFVERMNDQPAWHKLANAIFKRDEKVTASRAFELAGAFYEVRKLPMFAGWPKDDGVIPIDTGLVALVREPLPEDPTPRVLGSASSSYTLVSNRAIAAMLDPISREWPIETVGVLRYGALTFATFDAGQFEVAGEQCRQYLFTHQGFDGTRGCKIGLTSVREVCMNTLVAGEKAASLTYMVRHVGDAEAQMEFYVNLVSELRLGLRRSQEAFAAMGATRVEPEQAKSVIDAAYPMPKTPKALRLAGSVNADSLTKDAVKALLAAAQPAQKQYESDRERATALREAAYGQYERLCDEFDRIAETAWAAYNAVTETSTWREGPNADESLIYGVRAEEIGRAYDKAMSLVEVRA